MSLKPDDKARVDPVVEACSGLAHLCCGQYKEAAAAFCAVDPSFMSNGPVAGINFAKEVLTGNDIAVYGGLCALASLNRHELTSKVLENANFRSFLELEPHIRRAINAFCGGKYSACLGALESYRADYLLDVYLSSSVADLYSRIRTKSIVAYFLPYSCVQLSSLAAAFPAPHFATAADTPHDADDAADADEDTDAMESELTAMIQSGALRARIDTVSRLLVAPQQDMRGRAHGEAVDTAAELEATLRLKLHKINMVQAGLVAEPPLAKAKTGKVWGGGAGAF
ncbi:hypothetical protein LTR28_002847 [Elasticomyces elasticus]|nr:hypothetical protein LTR28_002847 [Elasticomyces elasticus]